MATRMFNPYRRAASTRLRVLVWEAVETIVAREQRSRSRKDNDGALLVAQVDAILSDLAHLIAQGGDALLVHRSKRYLSTQSRYRSNIERASIRKTLDMLEAIGLASQSIGSAKGRRLTRLSPGTELMKDNWSFEDVILVPDGEVIVLKGPRTSPQLSPAQLDYLDCEHTERLRLEMETVNKWLEKLSIGVRKGAAVDPRERRLRRIFNNGSFDQGGRLYGGFWQTMPKLDRFERLMLRGEAVAELDYRQMFARLLYAIAGKSAPPGDLYLLPGLEDWRDGIKRLFNAMIFKEGEIERKPKGTRDSLPPHLKASELARAVRDNHPAIAPLLDTSVGMRLMHHESEILLRVLQLCRDADLPALPIHDAILVPLSGCDRGRMIMERAFKERMGVEVKHLVATHLPPPLSPTPSPLRGA